MGAAMTELERRLKAEMDRSHRELQLHLCLGAGLGHAILCGPMCWRTVAFRPSDDPFEDAVGRASLERFRLAAYAWKRCHEQNVLATGRAS